MLVNIRELRFPYLVILVQGM